LDLPDQFEKRKKFGKDKYLDLRDLFKLDEDDMYEGFSYFQYEGSLTSPTCQEDTTWFVTSSPFPISYTTIEYFKDVLRPQTFDANLSCDKMDLSIGDEAVENTRSIQKKRM